MSKKEEMVYEVLIERDPKMIIQIVQLRFIQDVHLPILQSYYIKLFLFLTTTEYRNKVRRSGIVG